MPVPTDILSEQLQETNRKLVESNERLAKAIQDLSGKFDQLRVDISDKLGSINSNLEGFRGRTETSLAVAKWGVGFLSMLLVGLLTWSYSAHERAVKIEDSILLLRDITKSQGEQLSKHLSGPTPLHPEPRGKMGPIVPFRLDGYVPPDKERKNNEGAG